MESNASLSYLGLSLLASVAPTLLYVLLVYALDRYEREPLHLLAVAFLWGAIPAVLAALVLELLFAVPLGAAPPQVGSALGSILVAPPVEEVAKAALVALYLLRRAEFDGALDGVIYGSIIGLGFAMTENLFYYLGAYAEGGASQWTSVVLARAAAFGLSHATYTAFTGVGLGVARLQRPGIRRPLAVISGLGVAVSLHMLHNLLATSQATCLLGLALDWLGVGVIVAVVLLSWARERGYLREQLPEEVALGVLTPVQGELLTARLGRLRRELELLGAGEPEKARAWRHLHRTATELAFKKHQHAALGEEAGSGREMARLRRELLALRHAAGEQVWLDPRVCVSCGHLAGQVAPSCPLCGYRG